ncbi:hypothetical protein BDV33DRAFT_188388 [Aspergillus novoparasiticus]|uniref:Uncharacterized protein n=1 Tax=Aspergillus novoparasiticus TaxID=986946 RepID=A0A5N6F3G6_9EURO|nr:hypothetical protein BDV33DRAFT_188388 [Aspergillus novoparasiticus]
MPDNSAKVVRVKEHFAVKLGNGIPLSGAENMRFLAANSNKALVDSETNRTFIIMEYIHGDTHQKLRPSLTPAQKTIICKLPYHDGVFWTKDYIPLISGPFASQKEMNCGIIERLSLTESPQYIRLLQNMVDSTLHNHRTVFTHGDLQPKHIMVDEVESFEDGSLSFKITLKDWELAGWYPEYWDFCNATICCRFKPDWLELIPDILDEYHVEYLMVQIVYSSVFY